MKNICPNLSDPEVAREFLELVNATTEKAAYHIWKANNGYSIDKAPNGALSKLYQDLLNVHNGDRVLAMRSKAKVYSKEFANWFGDWIEDPLNASKVVDLNGEPLIVYHGTNIENISIFDRTQIPEEQTLIGTGTATFGNFFSDNQGDAKSFADITKLKRNSGKATVYSVFLNIKNPMYFETLGDFRDYSFKEGHYNENGDFVSDVKLPKEYDGVIVKRRNSREGVKEFVAPNSNQIKSATNNKGTFKSGDIYNNLEVSKYEVLLNHIDELKRQGLIRFWKGLLFIPKSNQGREYKKRQIDEYCRQHNIFYSTQERINSTTIRFHAYSPKDSISKQEVRDEEKIVEALDYMFERIPSLRHAEKRFETIGELRAQGFKVPANATAFIDENGIIHLVKGRVTVDSAIEECLHPLVLTLQYSNHTLFDQLYEEACRLFPGLVDQINTAYSDKNGFNERIRRNEIVTLALTRHVRTEMSKEERKTWKELRNKFFTWVAAKINSVIAAFGYNNKNVIYPEDLPQMSLGDLATLISATDVAFKVNPKVDNVYFNLTTEEVEYRLENLYNLYEKSESDSNKKQEYKTKIFEAIHAIKAKDQYEAQHIALKTIIDTVGVIDENGNAKPGTILHRLINQLKSNYSGMNAREIVDIWELAISPMESLVKDMPSPNDPSISAEFRDDLNKFRSSIDSSVKQLWVEAMKSVVSREISNIIDEEVEASELIKQDMKTVSEDWAFENMYYGDISTVLKYFGNYGYSTNPIIKQAFHLIQAAETRIAEESEAVGHRLTRAFNRANRKTSLRGWTPGWQTIFQEKDENGEPTGYFIRPINFGLYYKDRDEFIRQLNDEFDEKYGHHYFKTKMYGTYSVISKDGDVIGDASLELWVNGTPPPFVEYIRRIEAFKSERLDRRYTSRYYEEMLSEPWDDSSDNFLTTGIGMQFKHGLSPDTYEKYNYLHTRINYYLGLCEHKDSGISHPEDLSPLDRQRLDELTDELKLLSNVYNEDGTQKQGDQRRMALELSAWLKWIGDLVSSEVNWNAFYEELDKVKQKANEIGDNSIIDDFLKYNCSLRINPDYLDEFVLFGNGDPTVDEVKLQLIKSSLQNIILSKDLKTYTRDFRKMIPYPKFWQDCRRIDLAINDATDLYKPKSPFLDPEDPAVYFLDVLYQDDNGMYVKYDGTTQSGEPRSALERANFMTWYDYLLDYYTDEAIANGGILDGVVDFATGQPIVFSGSRNAVRNQIRNELFEYTFRYVNKETGLVEEKIERLSVLKLMVPTQKTFFNHRIGRTQDTVALVPSNSFLEKQLNSVFVNPNYSKTFKYIDHEGYRVETDEIVGEVPNQFYDNGRYDNTEEYAKMRKDKDVAALYDEMIDVMKRSRENYNLDDTVFNYQLPGQNADNAMILSRIFKGGNLFKWDAWKKWGKQISDLMFTVQEDDEDIRREEDGVPNPDGTVLFDVPRRYIGILDDKSSYTSDVVSSVIAYHRASSNYKHKRPVDEKIKTLRYAMMRENRQQSSGESKNSLEMLTNMMNKHLYDRQWADSELGKNNIEDEKNVGNVARNLIKDVSSGLITGGIFGAFPIGTIAGGISLAFGGSIASTILISTIAGAGFGALLGGVTTFARYSSVNSEKSAIAKGKAYRKALRLTSVQILGLNYISMMVGFLDSITRATRESMMMRYLTPVDYIIGIAQTIYYLPAVLFNIKNPHANNKLTAMMHLNGISKSQTDIYKNVARGRFKKLASGILMDGFSMFDWISNAALMRAYYNNIRYYEDKSGEIPAGFYSRYELQQAFLNVGRSKLSADLAHTMCCTTTMWDAYLFNNNYFKFDGDLKIKDKYKHLVSEKSKVRVRSKTLQRSALMNGMNPDNDIPIFKNKIWGLFIGAMRGWLTQQVQHLVAGNDETSVREFEERPVRDPKTGKQKTDRHTGKPVTKKVRVNRTPQQELERMSWNYETGTPQAEILHGLFRSIILLGNIIGGTLTRTKDKFRKLSEVEKYAWKDAIITLSLFVSLCLGYTNYTAELAHKGLDEAKRSHKGEMILNPIEYINSGMGLGLLGDLHFRLIESYATGFNPTTAMDVVNSIAVGTSAINDWSSGLENISDMAGLGEHDPNEKVKTGSYVGYTRSQRALYRTFGPLDNLHTITNPHHLDNNLTFYENTLGGPFRWFGYDFKQNRPNSTIRSSSSGSRRGGANRGSSGRGGANRGSGRFL